MHDFKTKRHIIPVILIIMTAVQIMSVAWAELFEKQDGYLDETWSYGAANSYFDPYIYMDKEEWDKGGVWRDGKEMHDYITVQQGERFAYDSVWYGQINDRHPPLYYAVLHTICSFFPDSFSYMYAFVINLVSMAVGQFFLYKAARLISRSDICALAACLWWGFSAAFFNVHIFLRLYSMLTVLSILFIYLNARIFYEEGSLNKNAVLLALTVCTAALTNHVFLAGAFIVTAVFCFYYLIKKAYKKLIIYSCASAGGVLLSVAAFPASVNHFICESGTDAANEYFMPFVSGFRSCICAITSSLTGISVSIYASGNIAYIVAVTAALAVLLAAAVFLLRKESWFNSAVSKVGELCKKAVSGIDVPVLAIILSAAGVCAASAVMVNINEMGDYIDRYLFFVMPWVVIAAVSCLRHLFTAIKAVSRFMAPTVVAAAVLFSASSRIVCPERYIFDRNIQGMSIEQLADKNSSCMILLGGPIRLTKYPPLLMNCDEYYFCKISEWDKHISQLNSCQEGNDRYIIAEVERFSLETHNNGVTEDIFVSTAEEVLGCTLELCGSEMIYGKPVHTYKVIA